MKASNKNQRIPPIDVKANLIISGMGLDHPEEEEFQRLVAEVLQWEYRRRVHFRVVDSSVSEASDLASREARSRRGYTKRSFSHYLGLRRMSHRLLALRKFCWNTSSPHERASLEQDILAVIQAVLDLPRLGEK